MLRLGTPATDRRPRPATRERLRLWMLFAAACVVLFGIRMLREPETAQRIDSLFLQPERPDATPATIDEVLGGEASEVEISSATTLEPPERDVPQPKDSAAKNARFDLSAVRDNTYFRPEENAAWFAVFDWLLDSKPDALAGESIGEVSYAQFIDQSAVYRGQVVTIRGTIERVEELDAPANGMGIKQYHRLVLRPMGGGVWPIVVYCLELPPNFPRDENVNVEVEVNGVFFKNWSYSWQGGLGLAPVVLAKSIDWHPVVSIKRPRTKISVSGLVAVTAAAGVIATFVGWFAWRHTRRPSDVLAGHRVVIAPPPEEN